MLPDSQQHKTSAELGYLTKWEFLLESFFPIMFQECKRTKRSKWVESKYKKLSELPFLSLQTYSQVYEKKNERFLKKQERKFPQRQFSASESFTFQPSHTEPQNVVVIIPSVVMNCSTSLLGCSHFPYQSMSSQKVFSAKTGSFSTIRYCLHTVLD